MKVSIPCMGDRGKDEKVSSHFGRAPAFVVYDDETDEMKTVSNTSEHMGGSGKPPELMAEEGVDVMLTSNLGRRAVDMFDRIGIKVYCGASGTVGDAIEQWKNGELEEASKAEACDHGHH